MAHEQPPHQDKYYRRRMSYEFGVVAPEHEADLLEGLCEGFVRANQIQIRARPSDYPCCLTCGGYEYVDPENCRVYDWKRGRAAARDSNCQNVLGAWPLDVRKKGTCIDLACMLCAIFREKDGDPRARVIIEHQYSPNGQRLDGKYHAKIMRGDGTQVDPSADLDANAAAIHAGQHVCDCP